MQTNILSLKTEENFSELVHGQVGKNCLIKNNLEGVNIFLLDMPVAEIALTAQEINGNTKAPLLMSKIITLPMTKIFTLPHQ